MVADADACAVAARRDGDDARGAGTQLLLFALLGGAGAGAGSNGGIIIWRPAPDGGRRGRDKPREKLTTWSQLMASASAAAPAAA